MADTSDPDSGNLWFAGRHGLAHVSIADLDAFADGRSRRFVSHLVEHDRRMSKVFDKHAFPRAVRGRDGTLYIAVERGVATKVDF